MIPTIVAYRDYYHEQSCSASKMYEATLWLRKMIGLVAAKDLPVEPSEEKFRLGLRSGIIICNAINKFQPRDVPTVVESPCDAVLIPDGATLSAFQYFVNVRNFLVVVQEMGLPSFEASDLEQGGKSRVVNCVLALKSYHEWKHTGGNGVWKFGENVKPTMTAKSFVRKNSEQFMNSLSRTSSMNEKSLNSDSNKMSNSSLSMLIHAVLSDKKPEEVPTVVESVVLSKVMEEFQHRVTSQCEQELKHNLPTTKAGMHILGLAHAASGYHRVLKENCKLYNQVQDLKRSIRVYCRVRPFLSRQSNCLSFVDLIEVGNITISTPSKHGKGRRSFSFNKVFGPSALQAEVFSDMQPLIRLVLDGFNVCIFAYG